MVTDAISKLFMVANTLSSGAVAMVYGCYATGPIAKSIHILVCLQ